MPIYQLETFIPSVHPSVYVADSADIIGQVTLAEGVSVWPHASIRGDNAPIAIGSNTSIQEGSVLHVDEGVPMRVGANVTVGHQAMLHGCTIQDGSLIGMQAIVLNRAVVGKNCLIGAGAIVPEGREIPDGSLVIGVGKIARALTPEEIAGLAKSAAHYVKQGARYKTALKRIG